MNKDLKSNYRSPQQSTAKVPRQSTTYRTPLKPDTSPLQSRKCALHFCEYSHICLSCRKSICLRCILTYCQQHPVRSQQQALTPLREELIKLEVIPRIDQINLKLSQSEQRRQYLQKKILKLIATIQNHFDYITQLLTNKKKQIIEYYDSEFQKYIDQHYQYNRTIKDRAEWLRKFMIKDAVSLATIEQIDIIALQIKEATVEDNKAEKKVMKSLVGKHKIGVEKSWSQENLQKILFQIQRIPYRKDSKSDKSNKRLSTQKALINLSQIGFVRSNSNSRFLSGRKQLAPWS